jgi:ubiquinone/menaquinone biosynthesis C-methylase UbiE
MNKDYELQYHLNEEKNWWFVARRNAIMHLIKHYDKGCKILDKNAGFNNIYGIDFSRDAIELCKTRNLQNVFEMDAHALAFKDNEFDLIIASDCLEHLQNDEKALNEWYRVLKKGGEGIIFVPAFNFLWSSHDEVNQHYRRYTKTNLNDKLIKASFNIIKSCYWNFTLFFPTSLIRLIQTKLTKPKKSEAKGQIVAFNPMLNTILINLLKFENRLFSNFGLPVGVSVFSLVKKN